jgi:hypothetical protein
MKAFRNNLSGITLYIFFICLIGILGIKLFRNSIIYRSNIEQLNIKNADCSASRYEFVDLLNSTLELENNYIGDFELLTSNNEKLTLDSIKANSEGLILLYFPKTLCEKCIQEQIRKVLNSYSSRTNFYLIIPLVIAQEIRSVYTEVNENKIFYYYGNTILIHEPMKPILIHLNSEYVIDKSFVIQKINIEYNDKFLKNF